MAHQTHAPSDIGGTRYGTEGTAAEDARWLTFAAVMFFGAAIVNTVWGIAALVNDDYFAADELLFGDLSMWGVFYLCLAAVQALVGVLVLNRSTVGILLGLFVVLTHATVALLSIGAYPVWSVVVLVIDGLLIYALTVHSDVTA